MARILIVTLAFAAATPALAADAGHGKSVFNQKCAVCHSVAPAGKKIGPTLYGVAGRQAASVPGYSYSKAMQAVGYAWSDDKLDAYLTAPKAVVPGTKMAFAGIKEAPARGDVIAYLGTLK